MVLHEFYRERRLLLRVASRFRDIEWNGRLIVSVKKLGAASIVVLLMVVAAPRPASAGTIAFNCITNNTGSCSSFAGLLTGTVTVSGNQLTALISNAGAGVISEVYVDAPGTGAGYALTGLIENLPGVDFTANAGSPPQLPAQNNALPIFVSDFRATANNPSPKKGAGPGEQIGLVFTLSAVQTQGQIDSLVASGALRFGLHVQDVPGPRITSESFVSGFTGAQATPVPEPATLLLFGTGLLAAARARRRKNR